MAAFKLGDPASIAACDALLAEHGLPPFPAGNVVNSTPHPDYRSYYADPETLATVRRCYAWEIDRFGFVMA